MKGMHGRGQSCFSAKFSFPPLKIFYDLNKTEGNKIFIPLEYCVGLLNPRLTDYNALFDKQILWQQKFHDKGRAQHPRPWLWPQAVWRG